MSSCTAFLIFNFSITTVRRIRKEENSTYSKSELPGRYTTKLLYCWDDGRFEREYLDKLERSWKKWKGRKFF